ncbi:MAG: hypothetical protein ABJ327_07450 [Litoreibacter sp.]
MIETLEIQDALTRERDLLAQTAKDPTQTHILFWQSPQALVVPRRLSIRPAFAEARAQLETKGWPVVTRATGGDVTPQGPGIVNVSLIYTPDGPPNIHESYDRLCTPMEHVLGDNASRGWNPGAFCDGAYNVQLNGLKFAGTAQRFKSCPGQGRSAVLSHALMLLRPPLRQEIDALNLLLSIMDEPRVIDINAHAGLPSSIQPELFVRNLHAAYLKALT